MSLGVDVQALSASAGVAAGGQQGGPLGGHVQVVRWWWWVEVGGCSRVHQHGSVMGRWGGVSGQVGGSRVGVVVVVVRVQGRSVVEVGGGHLVVRVVRRRRRVVVGEGGCHAHAHRSAVWAQVTWDAWQTSPFAFLLYMTGVVTCSAIAHPCPYSSPFHS